MTSPRRAYDHEPELVPPVELSRLRARLVRAPSQATRARHLAAITAAARERSSTPAGRLASKGARGAAAMVAVMAITTGLAAADVLPEPAQRVFSSVSDRFTPDRDDTPAVRGADDDPASTTSSSQPPATHDGGAPAAPAAGEDPSVTEPGSTTSTTAPGTTTTTRPPATTTTTIPGPTGPGSPDDPTDGGGDPTDPTDPVDPTTPGDPGTDPSPTDPDPGDGTAGPASAGSGDSAGGEAGGGSGSGSAATVEPADVSTTWVPAEDPVPPADGSR